ncbi:uncharacterized protein LOC130674381 [Microplitis mediator]|uniref:uncharacterized protein LOC130674381 n=1 Tax=Microplitis mediator TaxID=375433 RepID=UPI0025550CDD|nr:uncharacterized protein LOC130674381 [Microplitis mediator]
MEVDEPMQETAEFPTEVWEFIFKEVDDPFVLIRCQEISDYFFTIIDKLIDNYNWQKSSRTYINKNYLHEVMHKSMESFCIKNVDQVTDNKMWFRTFRSFCKWNMFLTEESSVNQVEKITDTGADTLRIPDITCVDSWHDFLAVGTKQGLIMFFQMTEDYESPQPKFQVKTLFGGRHEKSLFQVQFWSGSNEVLLAMSLSQDKTVRFWDIQKKTQIVMEQTILADHICSSTMYNCFIELNGKIVEYYYDQATELPKSRFEFQIDLEGDTVCTLFVHQAQPKLVSVNTFKILKMHYISSSSLSTGAVNYYQQSHTYGGKPLTSAMIKDQKFSVSAGSIVFAIHGINLLIHASGRKFTEHKLRGAHFSSLITHGNNLFLGINSGYIKVIQIKNLPYLLKYNINDTNEKIIIVDENSPIVHLAVTEHETNPYIFSAMADSVRSISQVL